MEQISNGERVILDEPGIIKIDRQFDLMSYYLPKDEEHYTVAEEDGRSLALPEVNIASIDFVDFSTLPCDSPRNGEERIAEIKKTGHIRLDAHVLHYLLEILRKDRYIIHERYAEDEYRRLCRICFDGTIFLRSGCRYVMSLIRGDIYPPCYGHKEWHMDFLDLSKRRNTAVITSELSAVLAA